VAGGDGVHEREIVHIIAIDVDDLFDGLDVDQ